MRVVDVNLLVVKFYMQNQSVIRELCYKSARTSYNRNFCVVENVAL